MIHQSDYAIEPEYVLQHRVAVKFVDHFEHDENYQIPYEDGAEESFPDDMKKYWYSLAEQHPEITLKRLYTSVTVKRIRELVAEAQRQDKDYKAPNFFTFFAVDSSSAETAMEIAKALSSWRGVVEYAYVQPPSSLPAITLNQKYIDAPIAYSSTINNIGGVDAMGVWSASNDAAWAFGDGVQYVDIERGWELLHPSLLSAPNTSKINFLSNINTINLSHDTSTPTPYFNSRHGTAVLGILSANDNQVGWKGISEKATGYVISNYWSDPNPANPALVVENIPNSIMAAIDKLNSGDVILLELETQVPGFGEAFWPVECLNNVFPVIQLAIEHGITVIEPAGNWARDFDSTITPTPFNTNLNNNPYFNQDSGAIIVGAAIVTGSFGGGRKGTRSLSSNFGNRVNCFAWSDSAYTLDINEISGTPAADRTDFGGTSVAAAIIAGAAIILQAAAKNKLGKPFSAWEVRNRLSDMTKGTKTFDSTPKASNPNPDPNADKIGVMPNLRKIIDAF